MAATRPSSDRWLRAPLRVLGDLIVLSARAPTRSGRHRRTWSVAATSFGIVALIAVAFAPAVVAKTNALTLTPTHPSVHLGQPTTIAFAATNTGKSGGAGQVGCIVIVVPPAFSVGATTVTSTAAGSSWTVGTLGGAAGETVVRLQARNDASVLLGDPLDQTLRFSIRVTGLARGNATWVANVYNKIDCTIDMALKKAIRVTVSAGTQPKPTPTAPVSPTAKPTPHRTPAPATTPPPIATAKPPTATATPPKASPPTSMLVPPSATPTPSPRPTKSPSTQLAAGGAGGADLPPGTAFTFTGSGSNGTAAHASMFGASLSDFTGLFGRAFDWAVPGVVLSVPGLVLVLAILAQAMGALAWLPLVRRRIGAFGFRAGT